MEQQTQSKIIKQLELDGYYVLKLIKTNKPGIPDLIAVKENECFFVEVKREKGKLSPIQVHRIKEMQEKGINVKIWTNYKTDFKLSTQFTSNPRGLTKIVAKLVCFTNQTLTTFGI